MPARMGTGLDELESLVDNALVQTEGDDGLRMLGDDPRVREEGWTPRARRRRPRGRHARPVRPARSRDPRRDRGRRRRTRLVERGWPQRPTSRPRSGHSGRRTDGDTGAARPGFSCAATSGCTGTSAASTSRPETTSQSFLEHDGSRHADARPSGRAHRRRDRIMDPRRLRAGERAVDRGLSARDGARCGPRALRQRDVLVRSVCSAQTSRGRRSGRASRSTGAATLGFTWAEGFASTFEGIVHALAGETDDRRGDVRVRARASARARRPRRCRSLARRLSLNSLPVAAIWPRRWISTERSLAAFEAIGDRAEEARILSEMAWTHLRERRLRRCAPLLPRIGSGVHRAREHPRPRPVADRARGRRGGRAPPRDGRPDRRGGGGLRERRGHRQRLRGRSVRARAHRRRTRLTCPGRRLAASEAGRRLTVADALALARPAEPAAA